MIGFRVKHPQYLDVQHSPAELSREGRLSVSSLFRRTLGIGLVVFFVSCALAEASDQIEPGEASAKSVSEKFGYINKAGRVVVPPQFDYTSDFQNGVATGTMLDKDGKPVKLITIDKNGHKLVERDPSGKSMGSGGKDGLTPIVIDSKYGYADKTGRITLEPQFKSAKEFEDGYAEVSVGDSWTPMIINRKGEIVIDLSKPPTDLSSDGFQIIRLPGATFCRSVQTGLSRFHDALACVHRNTWSGYVDKTGAYVVPLQDCIANDFSEGLARVQYGLRQSYIDEHGKKVFTLAGSIVDAGDFHDGRAPVLVRAMAADERGQPLGKIGFIDKQGKMVIPPKILPEHNNRLDGVNFSNKLCRVSNGTKYGYIDLDGKLVIPYKFKYACDFHEELAAFLPGPDGPTESTLTSSDPASTQSDSQAAQQNEMMDERVKLRASLNGDPFFLPATERLRILEKIVQLDDLLKDDSKEPRAVINDLAQLEEVYEELDRGLDAERVLRRFFALGGDSPRTAKVLLMREHRYKELEEILTSQIDKPEKIEIAKSVAELDKEAAYKSPSQQTLQRVERETTFKREMKESRFLEPIVELGDLYYATSQYPKAKERYEQAFKLTVNKFPTAVYDFNDDARWRILLFDTIQGDYKEASDKFDEILATAAAAKRLEHLNDVSLKSYLALLHLKSPSDFAKEMTKVPKHFEQFPSATWGFIDESGKQIISSQYTEAGAFHDGLANVALLGGWGYIDHANNWKIQPQFYSAKSFNEGLAVVSQSVKAELPLAARYQQKNDMKATGMAIDCSYGLIDHTGKYVIEPRFFEATDLSQDVSAVCFWHGQIGRNYGYVDNTGKVLMPPSAMATLPIRNGIAQVKIRHKSGQININGVLKGVDRDYDVRIPVTAFPEWIKFFNQYLLKPKLEMQPAHVATTEFLNPWPEEDTFEAKFGFVDIHGEVLIKPQYTFARPFTEGLAAVQIKDKWGFINAAHKQVIPAIYDDAQSFDGGCARVQKNGQWGLVDKTGRNILPCAYKSISEFSEGLAVIAAKDESSGFVDHQGKITIPADYSAARPFVNGFAAVRVGQRWGFINKKGELIIAARFSDVRDFSEGAAAVNFAE